MRNTIIVLCMMMLFIGCAEVPTKSTNGVVDNGSTVPADELTVEEFFASSFTTKHEYFGDSDSLLRGIMLISDSNNTVTAIKPSDLDMDYPSDVKFGLLPHRKLAVSKLVDFTIHGTVTDGGISYIDFDEFINGVNFGDHIADLTITDIASGRVETYRLIL